MHSRRGGPHESWNLTLVSVRIKKGWNFNNGPLNSLECGWIFETLCLNGVGLWTPIKDIELTYSLDSWVIINNEKLICINSFNSWVIIDNEKLICIKRLLYLTYMHYLSFK